MIELPIATKAIGILMAGALVVSSPLPKIQKPPTHEYFFDTGTIVITEYTPNGAIEIYIKDKGVKLPNKIAIFRPEQKKKQYWIVYDEDVDAYPKEPKGVKFRKDEQEIIDKWRPHKVTPEKRDEIFSKLMSKVEQTHRPMTRWEQFKFDLWEVFR